MAAVVAALRGAGPWAIYVQTIVGSVMTTALLWHLSPWRPTRTYRPESLRRFLAFGGYGVGSGILGEIEQRVGSMVLGRYSGAFETGLFQRASSLQVMLARLLSGVVTRVAFPTFAALQEDPRRLLSAIREAVFINFAASALVMWIVALLAEPIIRIVFGPPWVPSAPVLQAFCVAGGFYPVFAVFSKALRAMGHARGVFVQHVVRAGGMATAAVLFGRSGFVQMAWAQAAFLVMTLPMGSVGIARRTGYGLKSQLMDLAPVVLAGVAMAFVGTQVARVVAPAGSDFLVILLVGAACSLTFAAALFLFALVLPMPAARMAWTTAQSIVNGVRSSGKI
jgi:teichuronic acid exporter